MKSFFYLTKNRFDIFYKNLVLYLLQNRSNILQKLFFFLYTNTDLIFFTKLFFLSTQKQIRFLFNKSNLFFFLIHKNISELKKKKKRGYIHKINLFELRLVKCLSYVQHIIHIMHKGYISH